MAGRQVVQVYLSKPAVRLDEPKQELCAFAKTRALAPGETQTLTCSFALPEMAAYDAGTAAYLLEAGDYPVRVGVSSAETAPAAVLHLDKTVTTLQAKMCWAARISPTLPSPPPRYSARKMCRSLKSTRPRLPVKR